MMLVPEGSVSSVNATLVVAKILYWGKTIRRAQRDRNHANEHVYDECDLCRPLLPVAYSPSGHHCSGSKSGFIKCAVLKCELEGVSKRTKARYDSRLLAKDGSLERLHLHGRAETWFQFVHGRPESTPLDAHGCCSIDAHWWRGRVYG